MTAIGRSLGNLTTVGKVVLPLLLLVLVVAPIVTVLVGGLRAAARRSTCLASNLGIVRFVVAITAILLFSIPAAFLIIYMELKVIAFMNSRVGPGPGGPGGRRALAWWPGSRCSSRRTSPPPRPTGSCSPGPR